MDHKDNHKRKGKKSKVGPLEDREETDGSHATSFDLDLISDKTPQNNSKVLNTFRETVKGTQHKKNAIAAIIEAKRSASKWRSYTATRRIRPSKSSMSNADDRPKSGGIGLDDIANEYVSGDSNSATIEHGFLKKKDTKRMSAAGNRSLIDYFAKLGHSTNVNEVIDLEFVETLLNSGANINCTDRHGQGLLHEVARTWHTDVAKFLIEKGAEVNLADHYGRTPLHVASAVDYSEMVEILIEMKADKEARTKEEQTPVHYAAKNDACRSLKTLCDHNCLFDNIYDYKGRTPLHVAAELDRSESARFLLERNALVGVEDQKGNKALSWMIHKMPPAAHDALNQLHSTDRPNRNQYFYLNLLIHDRKIDPKGTAQSPLQVAVTYKQFDILCHRVFTKLIAIMWTKFARWRTWLNLILNFTYILLWSVLGILIEYDERHNYKLPEHWWRIVLLIAAIGFTVWQIVEEINEYRRSVRNHNNWTNRRKADINDDLQFCHPRWPEERAFLESELEILDDSSPRYFSDFWNIFDWVCYVFLMVSFILHIVDIAHHTEAIARAHIDIMAITIILLWLRILKSARSFSLIGPFIVILSHMITDLMRFAFLYLIFYLPYVCAFWMILGGNKTKYEDRNLPIDGRSENVTVSGLGNFNSVLFTMFRLTLVDDYDYDTMKEIDPLMTDILVGTWLALSAIISLNLFIALLSDTFQRVYDNAQANATMQKAITCLSVWEGMSEKSKIQFLDYIEKDCKPLKEYYDDDMTEGGDEDTKKVTIEIKEELDDFKAKWEAKFHRKPGEAPSTLLEDLENSEGGMISSEKFDNEVGILKEGIKELQVRQDDLMDRFTREMGVMKNLLIHMAGGGDGDLEKFEALLMMDDPASAPTGSDRTKEKRKKKKKKAPTNYNLLQLDDSVPAPYMAGNRQVDVSDPQFPSLYTEVSPHSHPGQDPSTEA